jgi:C4-dicarboxylate-specific signal transduction histidine kinase
VVGLATQAHDILLRKADSAAALAFEIATLTLIIVPLLALVTLFLLRRRILCPLRHLGNLMSLLARQEYGPAPLEKADPLLRPLLENYNRMVTRLAELERENEMRRHSLEKQVRAAAQSLLQQQRTLAQAEQLAVVGELSAQIAHNLRNPMAGMEMSLSNLRDEIDNPDHARRIGRVIDELHRMTLSLENLVDRSRHTPEAAKDFGLAETVDDLFELTRYQITESVSLVSEVPADPICRLPEDRLRQSLLNLILNSVEAIGPKPGRVVVSAARRNGQLRLSVCDDGPGFPEATLTKGLQPFVTGREHGTGLGLATAQRFAHDLGGGIELQNRHPRGACVTLRLPCE